MRSIVARLISASRYQDHTTSPSVCAPFVLKAQKTSTASRPTFVTIAIRPLCQGGTAGITKAVSTKSRNEIFLLAPLDSDFAKLPVGQISRFDLRRAEDDRPENRGRLTSDLEADYSAAAKTGCSGDFHDSQVGSFSQLNWFVRWPGARSAFAPMNCRGG
jgi:hypothetical protein